MKKIFPALFLFSILFSGLSAQKITYEEVIQVNYPINGVGYPSPIVSADMDKGSFSYVEFQPEDPDHRFTNHYIQTFDKDFKFLWDKPLTPEKSARLADVASVVRLKDAIAVVGYQYSPSIKRMATKMKVYDLNGQEQRGLTTISNYTKNAKKGYVEVMQQSPDRSKMLWMGHNPEASSKKRDFYCTVWDGSGKKVWGKRLLLQPTEDKYLVKQATVDNRGNAYFYMVSESATNTAKDTLNPPIIVRYDHRETKFSTYKLDFPGASVPEGRIYITNKGKLAFLGVLADGSEAGFLNGGKRFETALKWNKIVFQQFQIERDLMQTQNFVMDFPEAWTSRYGGERGANFSLGEIVEVDDQLYWVMEEFYTQIHREELQFLYYDIATIGIDMESGEIQWANTFEKKQRDYKSGRLLSYSLGLANGKLNFVYLNERGAQGKILCTSMDMKDGKTTTQVLARNDKATNLFFPKRSAMVAPNKMILMGVGNPVSNDYKLIEVSF